MNDSTAGNVQQKPQVRKFQELINAASGLYEVETHLYELMRSIGLSNPETKPQCGEPLKANEPTLISTLNELPSEIREKVKLMHNLIEAIRIELN